MPNTATRLITLIMLLQHHPNRKAGALAAELGVSVRTLHRYFSMLDEMGIPIYSERGPHGGFSLVRGYKMPPLMFTPEEAVAVSLGTGLVSDMWGMLYHEAATGALAKLENILPEEQRREVAWARRTLITSGLHRADLEALAGTLEKLRRAIREHRCVRMQYRSSNTPHPVERDFDPYSLIHRWGWWYAAGFCHTRQEVRTFRVDRITGLTLLDDGFEIPASFDVHAYLAKEPVTGITARLRLRFSPEMAAVGRENTAAWEFLENQPDGSLVVGMPVWDLPSGVGMALAYGPGVEILEPEEARRMAYEWGQAVARLYAMRGEEGK